MCWKHEDKYMQGLLCFDFVWDWHDVTTWADSSIVSVLENVGVKFSDKEKCKQEFFDLLSKWHKEGLIKP